MTPPDRAGPGPRQALLTLRIIAASMGMGVTFFAFVAWFAGLGEDGSGNGSGLVFGGLLIVATVALACAIVLWRVRVAPLARSAEPWDHRFPSLQTRLIVVWALIEVPAILAVAVYYLYDDVLSGLLGLAIIWVGVGLTWPRRSWIGAA